MQPSDWHGVLPAITTPFGADLTVDHEFLRRHVRWMLDHGARGIVALGSLGEGATLDFEEKVQVLESCRAAAGERLVVAGVAALGTAQAVRLAQAAERVGCDGLMVLPAYVHHGPWRETRAHVEAVMRATSLSCMLYNNPIAYGTDFLPEQVEQLCRNPTLHAVKESSGDVRRITAIRECLAQRLAILVGLDDLVVEGVAAGATGWIAGLVNALPEESVRLFELARAGDAGGARELYDWFLPLLRMDTVPGFVQLIKLVQQEAGMGSERVRPPRLPLEGAEREQALALIRERLATRPRAAAGAAGAAARPARATAPA